ncbi:tetratricopeptide repeat protein [Massilia niastensis]|uniref:tetratricopeptide repeat protein n=1 Tax=Massilia niastensis TaxID=544911 RepID=UPI0003726C2C|nr:SEL1-like repeat protein [Massilia niastensis]
MRVLLLLAAACAMEAWAQPPPTAAPQAQEAADGRAAYRLGLACRSGEGMPQDAALAARWLGVAARAGVPEAMFILANMLLDGEGVAKDEQEARRLLEAAAQRDHAEAWQQLALMEPDPARAAQLMRRAAHALTHR